MNLLTKFYYNNQWMYVASMKNVPPNTASLFQ